MSKVSILIDGGFFLKRLPSVLQRIDSRDPDAVADAVRRLVASHLEQLNRIEGVANDRILLYRSFFYDATPYAGRGCFPVSGGMIDYENSTEAVFRRALHDNLRSTSNMAVRLGEVRRISGWMLRERVQNRLRKGEITVADLTDRDFTLGLQQKAVDMRIGIDIASLTLKRQVSTIVLVSGDSDFVPASKFARREGVNVVLDPLWSKVLPGLFEHIDELRSGFPRPDPQQKAKRPAAKRPAAKRPAAKRPAAKRPAAKRPAAKRPAAKRPAAKRSAAKRSAASKTN